MSAYIYAIIPYRSGISFDEDDPITCIYGPVLSELDEIESEYTDRGRLCLFKDFLQINTCCRQSAFTNIKDGYCRLRSEICLIARALGASGVWYVEESVTDEMDDPSFSFDEWAQSLKDKNGQSVVELNTEILSGNACYSYYYDDFSDIIMERPGR